jgi:hypothetical protein
MTFGEGRASMWKAADAVLAEDGGRPGGAPAALFLGLVIAAVVGLRLHLLLLTDFPINDGGLFLEFVRGTAAVFPRIPESIGYNGLDIPFGYPPLSFWLGALLTKAGIDALGVVHALPILMNIAYALLFAILLLRSGLGRFVTALVLLFFLVNLRSYEWLAMGGGMSRGLGSLFLLLALLAVGIPSRKRRPPLPLSRLLLTGAAVGGAILSHLEWGLLAASSVVAIHALGCRSLADFIRSCFVTGIVALALILPWLGTVMATHGIEPFLAAGRTSQSGLANSIEQLLWLAKTNVFNIFIALGGLALVRRRRFFWIVFFLLCAFVTPRHGPTPAVLPLSVFSGIGVTIAYRLLRLAVRPAALAGGITSAMVIAMLGFQYHQEQEERRAVAQPLRPEQREAMAWVRRNQAGSRFAMLSDSATWQADRSAEWFPVLAGAASLTTVQGREWLPGGDFRDREEKVQALKASRTCEALLRNLKALEPPQFIWAETMKHCFAAPAYSPIFRNSAVTIFRADGSGQEGE